MPKISMPLIATLLAALLTFTSSQVFASKAKTTKFAEPVRIAYVPQRAFMVDNGVVSGALAPLIECSTSYFSNIEYVEMANYRMLMMSLETQVVDIGVNMVRSKARDDVAEYVLDMYQTRILHVNDGESNSNKGAGVLAVRQGSDLDRLLLAKGFDVNTKAYSIDRLIEMFRQNLINSFVETELSVFEELKTMDVDGIDFDYEVLVEQASGAYVAKGFQEKNPDVVSKWIDTIKSCKYLAPKIDG